MSRRLSLRVRDRISCNCVVGQRRVRVDEGQRHLAVQRGVQRLPELQGRRAAVEDQQPVPAAADDGARNEMDVLVGRRGLDGWLARHVEGQRFAGGIAAVVRRAVGRTPASAPCRWLAPSEISAVAFMSAGDCASRPNSWAGMSGWKSSADTGGSRSSDDGASGILVVAVLSGPGAEPPAGSLLTAGPFPIPSPATAPGGPRRTTGGLCRRPGANEFL